MHLFRLEELWINQDKYYQDTRHCFPTNLTIWLRLARSVFLLLYLWQILLPRMSLDNHLHLRLCDRVQELVICVCCILVTTRIKVQVLPELFQPGFWLNVIRRHWHWPRKGCREEKTQDTEENGWNLSAWWWFHAGIYTACFVFDAFASSWSCTKGSRT